MLSILYVDHDLVCRCLSTLTIWQLGYWNDVVASSERAIQAFQKRQYDLVFIDLAMPEMDGFALARAMRELEREKRQAPALLCGMSVIDDPVLRQRCRDAGMEEFIGRPCSCDDLRYIIRLAEALLTQGSGKGHYFENTGC